MSGKPRVLVGLSGGVDSAVSAYLLREQGYEVGVAFMKNFVSPDASCTTKADRDAALQVFSYLGLKEFSIFDFQKEYGQAVMDKMYAGYAAGLTPNPDILCNTFVKFGVFLEKAVSRGWDMVATGHYARVHRGENGVQKLLKGIDSNKDQSYFLSGLGQDQLKRAIFPVGEMEKPEVRRIAEKAGLPNAKRPDSQGLCFVGKVDMSEFLSRKIKPKPGDILDVSGKVLGRHEGAFSYTVGQRRGIKVGGGPALYVVSKDVHNNTITVGTAEDLALFSKKLIARDVHWVCGVPELPFRGHAKIRYRQPDQAVSVTELPGGRWEAVFDEPQRAVAPGQSIVLYRGDELVGSAVIESGGSPLPEAE